MPVGISILAGVAVHDAFEALVYGVCDGIIELDGLYGPGLGLRCTTRALCLAIGATRYNAYELCDVMDISEAVDIDADNELERR
jgi:hypothetical protein